MERRGEEVKGKGGQKRLNLSDGSEIVGSVVKFE
jgi:hypothetical protein